MVLMVSIKEHRTNYRDQKVYRQLTN